MKIGGGGGVVSMFIWGKRGREEGAWPFPVDEGVPEIFKRALPEITEPERRGNQLKCPGGKDKGEECGTGPGAKCAQAMAIENGSAEETLEDVIGKSHAANGAERNEAGAEPMALCRPDGDEYAQRDVAKRGKEGAPVIELDSEMPEGVFVPVLFVVVLNAEAGDCPADRDEKRGDGGVGFTRPDGMKEVAALQRHAQKNAAAATEEGPIQEVDGLGAKGFPEAVLEGLLPPAGTIGGEFFVDAAGVQLAAPLVEFIKNGAEDGIVPVVGFAHVDEGDAEDHDEGEQHEKGWGQEAEGREQYAADCVSEEDVAIPEAVGVKQAEDEEYDHSEIVDKPGIAAFFCGAFALKDDACTEQDGKDGDEFHVGEKVDEDIDGVIEAGERLEVDVRIGGELGGGVVKTFTEFPVRRVGGGVGIGLLGHGHGPCIHEEDAEDGGTAEEVKGIETGEGGGKGGSL